MVPVKPAIRFVPTLTEVVRPGTITSAPVIDRDALVEQVMQMVKPRLEQQLRTALYAMVEEQLREAAPQWQLDVEAAVNAAVEQVIGKQTPPKI
jgi:uncharacterized protein YgbK (DUF1537 family)